MVETSLTEEKADKSRGGGLWVSENSSMELKKRQILNFSFFKVLILLISMLYFIL